MSVVQQFSTSAEFWSGMVVPDYKDYHADHADLRRALHSASSLFHMHDWVFHTFKYIVNTEFTYVDKNGKSSSPTLPSHFANALERQRPEFGLIRGIANASKHLKLSDIRPVQNAPSDAASTSVQTTGYGQGGYGQGPYGGGPRVVLDGNDGSKVEFLPIVESVYTMWETIIAKYDW